MFISNFILNYGNRGHDFMVALDMSCQFQFGFETDHNTSQPIRGAPFNAREYDESTPSDSSEAF